jgi:hypothetical protein
MTRRGARITVFARLGPPARPRVPGDAVCLHDRGSEPDDRLLRDALDELPTPAMPAALRARIVRMVPRLPQVPPEPIALPDRSDADQSAPTRAATPHARRALGAFAAMAAAVVALVTGPQRPVTDSPAPVAHAAARPALALNVVPVQHAVAHHAAAPVRKAAAPVEVAQAAPVPVADPVPVASPAPAQPVLAAVVRPVMGPVDIPSGGSTPMHSGIMGPVLPQQGYGFTGGMSGGEFGMGTH